MPSPPNDLAGKVAIVTGGSRGIGAGICRELSARGANLVIVYASDSSTPIAEQLVKELTDADGKKRAIKIQAELSMAPDSPEALIVYETLGAFPQGIDILVNTVAQPGGASIANLTAADFDAAFRVNTLAPMLLTQAALPHLNRPARIINISSSISKRGMPGPGLLYCGSKAALESMSRCLAYELGADGTTVNCVLPGPVDTDMMKSAPAQMVEASKRMTPVENRVGTVEDIAGVVGFLASEQGKWISGQCISATGGMAML